MDKRIDEVIAGFPFPDLNRHQTERLILGEIQPEQYLGFTQKHLKPFKWVISC